MNTFKAPARRISAAQQAGLYFMRKRNRLARAAASPAPTDADEGVNRERLNIDHEIDIPIDNPDAE
jgi:hypothetical protein